MATKNTKAFEALLQRRIRELDIRQNIERAPDGALDLPGALDTNLELTREQIEAEKAQADEREKRSAEAMSSIGQSAFAIVHRLGNDLGMVRLLLDDIQEELAREHVSNPKVASELGTIAQLVSGILELSSTIKCEMGRAVAEVEEPALVAPGVLLEEAQASIAIPDHVACRLEIESELANVRVVPRAVIDILHNLIMNACEAMPQGGRLTLRARMIGRSVALEVIDSGVGIPEHRLARIFELFYSTKGSSGFGLWSARDNARKNHGTLNVESTLGVGTAFTLVLPKACEEDSDSQMGGKHEKTRACPRR